jgi:hypothetical protein
MNAKAIAERLAELKADGGKQRWTFTLEAGRGTTYRTANPVLYGHSVYPGTSVLAGRDRRVWLETWDTWEQARLDLKGVKERVKGFKYDDFGPDGGTTHQPLGHVLAGLPDDDY